MKKKIISALLTFCLLFGTFSFMIPLGVFAAGTVDVSDYLIDKSDIPLRLYYDEEASHGLALGYDDVSESFGSDSGQLKKHENDDWERWSIPLGNGYFGANVFGRTDTERIQLTDKTLANPYYVNNISMGGVNNFSETYIDFGHKSSRVTKYSRELDLKTAISTVSYVYNGVTYTREYFTSYEDNVMVIKLDASVAGALDFVLRPTIPYEQEYMNSAGDRGGKTGTVTSSVNNGVGSVVLSGTLEYFDIDFVGLYTVVTDGTGTVSATTCTNADGDTDGTITVSGATSAYITVNLGTDYVLSSETFTESTLNKPTFSTDLDDAMAKVEGYKAKTQAQTAGKSYADGYQALKDRHIADYSELFGRVTLDLNCKESDFALTTDVLLNNYKNGSGSTYLEALYFQYGRYLLIASSRSGALPANLQGTWNRYNKAPWSSGFWHNVNVQMNYWPAFSTNLSETFEAYVQYNDAYMSKAEQGATGIINSYNPSVSGTDGGNGWSIDTGAYVNDIYGSTSIGNLGFTTQLFWEYYEYTQDETLLREVVYPVLVGAARFITKMVREDADGNYIAIYTDSPEQYVDGVWYYTDKGTAYAQSFAYQNNYNMLLAAQELGIDFSDTANEDYAIIQRVLEQLDKYDPIRVGLSGQVKEFFEEEYYGDMGEKIHRHISQLVGLYPGNVINGTTPAWLDAAEYTLTQRGDEATGWGVAHRLNLWARVQRGDRAHDLLNQLLSANTATNLWDLHPPFQIDGNLGGTAGISEMLLQSHAGYIEPLAAIPESVWTSGSYTGLVARGNFEVAAAWADGIATSFNIKSLVGGTASVKYSGIGNAVVADSDGKVISYTVDGEDLISFETEAGKTYVIYGFKKEAKPEAVSGLAVTSEFLGSSTLVWNASMDAASYNVYVAKDNDPDYTLLTNTRGTSYVYTPGELENARLTFAVTAVGFDGTESDRALCYRNPDDTSATVSSVSANVVDGELQVAIKANDYAGRFKLYSRASVTADWELVTESTYPIIIYSDYNSNLKYGVSVVSFFGGESEITAISSYNQAFDEVDYSASNIFEKLKFNPSSTGRQYAHNSTTYGDYGKLTDGDFSTSSGRFSTKASSTDVIEATINLPTTFILGELRIFDFNGYYSSANYAGQYMRIEAAVDGKWTTVAEYSSNAEILALRKSGEKGNYIAVDLSLVQAQQIKVHISNPVSGQSISLNEIQCTGIALNKGGAYSENVLLDKQFELSSATTKPTAEGSAASLTDGTYCNSANPNYWRTWYNQTNMEFDGTVTLDGVANLTELRIYDYVGTAGSAASVGPQIVISVYYNGAWTTVYDVTVDSTTLSTYRVSGTPDGSTSTEHWLSFDLRGVKAEKLRIYMPPRSTGCFGMYEIECAGYYVPYVGEGSEVTEYKNILSDKTFVAAINQQMWYNTPERLTDGDYWNTSNQNISGTQSEPRYATLNTSTLGIDISVELGVVASLNQLRIKDHNGWSSSANYAGNAMTIQVKQDGNWVSVYEYSSNADILKHRKVYNGCNFLIFDMNGVYAEAIRIVIPERNGTYYIALEEVECSATVVTPAPAPSEDENTNVLRGTENGKITVSGATAHPAFKDKEYQMFDGDAGTRFAVNDASPYSYSVEVELSSIYPLYTLRIYPFHNQGEASRSDKTSVEVYLDGVWVKIVDNVTVENSSYTDISLGGVKAERIRITFANTTWKANASIYEIKCTTGSTVAVDRSALLDAYKALDEVDTTEGEFGMDAVKAEKLEQLKALLMDTEADQADVDGYVTEVNAAVSNVESGKAPVTDAYGDFTKFNLSLEGDIGFNFYGALASGVETAFPGAYVYVEYADGTTEKKALSDLETDASGRYVITLNMAAAQMADKVKMRLILDGSNCGEYIEQSVKDYAAIVLADSSYETAYPGITALVTAMLNYGGYAQTYFGYNTDDLANSGIDTTLGDVSTDAAISSSGNATGLTMSAWTLSLDTRVDAKLFFTLADGYNVNSYEAQITTPSGEIVDAQIVKVGARYSVVIENIPSGYLDDAYTVVITNVNDGTSITISSSAMCYVAKTLASTNEDLVNVVKALKLYSDAANNYYN